QTDTCSDMGNGSAIVSRLSDRSAEPAAGPRQDAGRSHTGITIECLTHEYRPARGRPVLALDNLNLEIRDREFIALLGPSGCGKSTLLYLLGGFLRVQQGEILVRGKPVEGPSPERGIVFQHFALYPWKTVRKNILYGLEKQKKSKAECREIAQHFINLVGLK